ncbi:hypothetical protein ACLOJK_016569 [Asimina triloba]
MEEAEAQDMESRIKCAMRARVADFREQADSLTLEGVRRALEKDMGLEELTLDAHKKFIKQTLTECFSELDDENASKNGGKNSEEVVTPKKEETRTTGEEEPEPHVEGVKPCAEDEVKKEDSPIPMDSQMAEREREEEENKGAESEKVLSEETIKKAIKKRASYLRANSETITFVLQSTEVESKDGLKKKSQKKASDSKADGGSSKGPRRVNSGDGSLDSDVSSSGEKELIKPKKQAVKKVAARNTEGPKKRKRSTEEIKPSSNGKSKPVKSAEGGDADEDGNSSGDGKSQSSAEEAPKKKRETSTQVYGKRVEHLKSIIKACGMRSHLDDTTSVPPSVYKKVKQAPENKREAHLIKELEEILKKEGLSSNPSEKEIKEVKKKKERAKELEGIDMSNIVSSTRRRSTSSFLLPPPPPPKAKLAVEKEKKDGNDDSGGDDDEDDDEDSDDEESESKSEGASEARGILNEQDQDSVVTIYTSTAVILLFRKKQKPMKATESCTTAVSKTIPMKFTSSMGTCDMGFKRKKSLDEPTL